MTTLLPTVRRSSSALCAAKMPAPSAATANICVKTGRVIKVIPLSSSRLAASPQYDSLRGSQQSCSRAPAEERRRPEEEAAAPAPPRAASVSAWPQASALAYPDDDRCTDRSRRALVFSQSSG